MHQAPIIIAEIGCNHKGKIEIASEMIEVATNYCKVDIVKFQKRSPKELLSPEEYNAPHPNPQHSYGSTYGEHREFLEFNIEQHEELKKWCEEKKMIYTSSIWDIISTKEVVSLYPKLIKIPSACNLDFDIHRYLISNFEGTIHISLGMTTHEEEEKIVSFYEDNKRNDDIVLYSCTSGYPVPFEDISLFEITRLKEKFGNRINSIGFSGHHLGIAADIAALTLGAEYFERHFTLDRTWKGTDHAASLEPDGMRKLARDLRNVKKSLTYKREEILEIEWIQREKLKRVNN